MPLELRVEARTGSAAMLNCKEGLKTDKVKTSLGKYNKKLSIASQSEPHIPSCIREASIGFSLCITLWGTNTVCAGERMGGDYFFQTERQSRCFFC